MTTTELEHSYDWILVLSALGAFFTAFGIGANDVANAFATSVGSKAISIKQAIGLAAVCEFSGAFFMGSHVTKTIRKGIADYECFTDSPGLLMYGCMCVIFAVGIWLIVATKYELPVSTTHSTVGGMIGMTIVAKGAGCVTWDEEVDMFPYHKGVTAIVLSWILSPLLSAAAAALFFYTVRFFVLRNDNSYNRSFWVYPILVLCTIVLNVFFIIYKGAKGLGLDDTSLETALAIAFATGGAIAVIIIPTLLPWLRKRIDAKWEAKDDAEVAAVEDGDASGTEMTAVVKANAKTVVDLGSDEPVAVEAAPAADASVFSKISTSVRGELNVNIDDVVKGDKAVTEIHDNAETFDGKTEEVFRMLQVFTAMCESFAHGANDTANAIGPFAAVWIIHSTGSVQKEADMGTDALWILAMGGMGIVLGLATYGYKIMKAIGVKFAKVTPSRGFCIEIAVVLVIIIGSRLEIPLSTTHCSVGAIVGVGMLEGASTGDFSGVNWRMFAKICAGWILTLVIVGCTTAVMFAQGAYAPCA